MVAESDPPLKRPRSNLKYRVRFSHGQLPASSSAAASSSPSPSEAQEHPPLAQVEPRVIKNSPAVKEEVQHDRNLRSRRTLPDSKAPLPPPVPESSRPLRGNRAEKVKFFLSLSKDEIEEDFIAMTGSKPPRRPQRRPKSVQEQIDHFFPGTTLPQFITLDLYKLPSSH